MFIINDYSKILVKFIFNFLQSISTLFLCFIFISRLVLFRFVSQNRMSRSKVGLQSRLDTRSLTPETIEDRDTRRTFRGYRENDLIIACKTMAKDKALDTRLLFKHTDNPQTTCKYFHIAKDSSSCQAQF